MMFKYILIKIRVTIEENFKINSINRDFFAHNSIMNFNEFIFYILLLK